MTRVALVTGGAVRVGRAITLGLADAGFDVAINYHNSEAQAQDVARNVEAKGKRAIAVRGDVSDKQDIDRLVDSVRSEYGRLDLLVNNASVFLSTPFLEVDEAEWDRVMAVNLKGPFLLTQATSNLLAVSRGHVINIVDLSAFQPWMSYPHHSVSKAGLPAPHSAGGAGARPRGPGQRDRPRRGAAPGGLCGEENRGGAKECRPRDVGIARRRGAYGLVPRRVAVHHG